MVSLSLFRQDASIHMQLDLLGHHVTLTWGQILTLIFQCHTIYISMRIDKANTMVSKSLLYLFKHGSYHRKTILLQNVIFDINTSDA